ncbi:MAG TPA: hypothetical protein VNO30_21020 [Kofleriaceae bacterium]|nr:hypothetical protein [Kofleriaceae bacterium]
MSTSFSPALRKLLDAHIESFEKLELLMFLLRSPSHHSTVGDLSLALDLGGDEVRAIALALSTGGLVTRAADGRIALAPQRPEEGAVLDELARVYDEDRMTLVTTIAETAMNRLRSLAGRALADAFATRKKKQEDDER